MKKILKKVRSEILIVGILAGIFGLALVLGNFLVPESIVIFLVILAYILFFVISESNVSLFQKQSSSVISDDVAQCPELQYRLIQDGKVQERKTVTVSFNHTFVGKDENCQIIWKYPFVKNQHFCITKEENQYRMESFVKIAGLIHTKYSLEHFLSYHPRETHSFDSIILQDDDRCNWFVIQGFEKEYIEFKITLPKKSPDAKEVPEEVPPEQVLQFSSTQNHRLS